MEIILPNRLTAPVTAADSSQIGHARRQAIALADAMGFDVIRQSQLGIVVTEAAGNIASHAGQGEIILVRGSFAASGIDVMALDKGKGMANVGRSFEDGFSTAGTLGQGLGAVSRLAGMLQIYSLPEHGTVFFARVMRDSRTAEESRLALFWGWFPWPRRGRQPAATHEAPITLLGEAFIWSRTVLGTGRAADAADEAIRVFRDSPISLPKYR